MAKSIGRRVGAEILCGDEYGRAHRIGAPEPWLKSHRGGRQNRCGPKGPATGRFFAEAPSLAAFATAATLAAPVFVGRPVFSSDVAAVRIQRRRARYIS